MRSFLERELPQPEEPPVHVVEDMGDSRWPVLFAAQALDAPRMKIRPGQLFWSQDKRDIRGLGLGYGIEDAMTRDFSELPYVETLLASQAEAQEIIAKGQHITEAKKFVGIAEGEAHVAVG